MIDKIVAELTLDEKVLLTAGADLWSTVPIDRLGVPKVRVTDGPNGARGPVAPGEGVDTSACVPCGSALGATWDPALVEEVGALLGREARRKGCHVLLAPTVNIHRSPLAGRNFECYSEDPLLSGRIAAGFVRGVQSERVATTVKHFAGNDAEFERHSINSVIDQRTLREIYLLPFELAVREGGTLGIMTGYNRLNGPWCAEHEELLAGILRREWGFEGFVISDWFAMGSTDGSARAGLDLEMPGPGRFFGPKLAAAVRAGEVDEALVDAQIRRMLTVWERLGVFDDGPLTAGTADLPEDRALARRAASGAMVLLRNDGVLPLELGSVRSVALIGPNADRAQIMGGGSANFRPHYRISPLQAITAAWGDRLQIRHARGCDIDRTAAPLTEPQAVGLNIELFAGKAWEGEPVDSYPVVDSRMLVLGDPPGLDGANFSARMTGTFVPDDTGSYEFTLVQGGRVRVTIDGTVVLDGFTDPPPIGKAFFGMASEEVSGHCDLVAGQPSALTIEYSSEGSLLVRGFVVGCHRPVPDDLLARAVDAAAGCDVAVVVVGTNADWESEGYDRADMNLPGEQDELIRAVAAANPRTVVVVNSGSPVEMSWADEVGAVVQAWFGGQEMANGLVDVLSGEVDPGGRLPTTLPVRLEHNPSFGNFPGENGEVRYGEGVLVGYRWYEARHLPVRYPFGHGLSYTTFSISAPAVTGEAPHVQVQATVTNTGDRPGVEVVQCYVAPIAPGVVRPPKELKAFAHVRLAPGESTIVRFELDDRAFAYWDAGAPGWPALHQRMHETLHNVAPETHRRTEGGWRVDPGEYQIQIGRSSADIAHVVSTDIPSGAA